MAASDQSGNAVEQAYLAATTFIDSDNPRVRALADEFGHITDLKQRAIAIYYAVRDRFLYDPYSIDYSPKGMSAGHVVERGRGFCVSKAILLAAVARAAGIPSRLGFADVKNHLATPRLLEMMGTDIFHFHGYTELLIEGRWVKATPAFNIELCDKFRVKPLEFDGETDSVFHAYDADNRRHMEYVTDRGQFADLPYVEWLAGMKKYYPNMMHTAGAPMPGGDFAAEAEAAQRG
ncbi:transglutaminase family protein [Ferrovibrio sp. MS7]|jgi:transglutaminase-like putative cysteine protease|uniref:transglutaminase-like domain-containing protein n=1 Tax=Ferrovibrio plantarum TaxID=3119164 RepID=UPI001B638B51|nr:transglutaminase family protein [Ferrovibrio sp.]